MAKKPNAGTSVFDPVLCELAYRWFCPPGGLVLDPFAGGSVRGIVAGKLGRDYHGIDLRQEQVDANRHQGGTLLGEGDGKVQWTCGDSLDVLPTIKAEADFVFSCPPYADLEVYSDDPRDLSTMEYDAFIEAYTKIIVLACDRLRDNSFACFVVGDVRGPDGCFRSFPQHTIEAFAAAGLKLYNDAILVTAVGTLPVRVGRQFAAGRKLGSTHQRVLVFVKGDGKKATDAVGECDFADAAEEPTGDESQEAGAEPQRTGARFILDSVPLDDDPTPVERVDDPALGTIWLKRDDLFEAAGVRGGKVRSCWALASAAEEAGSPGLITAGSKSSPQVNIVAQIGAFLGMAVRAHVPSGELGREVQLAQEAGAEIVQHKPGYNTVIVARARKDAKTSGWTEIPFGMECEAAVRATATQVPCIPSDVTPSRIVVPVGSGMSLAGILWGLHHTLGQDAPPVLGVVVGADPIKRLDAWAPPHWRDMVTLEPAGVDYHQHIEGKAIGGVDLDPVYEAKCLPFLRDGDLLWIVGIRQG